MRALDTVRTWPGTHAAAVVRGRGEATVVERIGPMDREFHHASVTKVATSLAILVEVSAGSCSLDDPVGPPGATLRHLLAHASGLPLDASEPVAAVGARRIYSNAGIDLAAAHAAAAAGVKVDEHVRERVFAPLGMDATRLAGRAASGAVGSTDDLVRLARELLAPTLVPTGLSALQATVAFPGLNGVLPGFGRQEPCDWGLGLEVKGAKRRHWTGPSWPAWTVGHFGQAGGFVAVDAHAAIAIVTLGDAPFGRWAISEWPGFSDALRGEG